MIRRDRDGLVRFRKLKHLIVTPDVPSGHRAHGQGRKTQVAESRMLAALAAQHPAGLTAGRLCGNAGFSVLLSLVQRGLVECLDNNLFRLIPQEER